MATIEVFEALDLRVGRVLEATDFPQARKPAYRLTIEDRKSTRLNSSH